MRAVDKEKLQELLARRLRDFLIHSVGRDCALRANQGMNLPADLLPINDDVLALTRDEIVDRIDREARRRLKISAKELIRRYRSGTLKDSGYVADLLMLADLLPDNDPIFVAA